MHGLDFVDFVVGELFFVVVGFVHLESVVDYFVRIVELVEVVVVVVGFVGKFSAIEMLVESEFVQLIVGVEVVVVVEVVVMKGGEG